MPAFDIVYQSSNNVILSQVSCANYIYCVQRNPQDDMEASNYPFNVRIQYKQNVLCMKLGAFCKMCSVHEVLPQLRLDIISSSRASGHHWPSSGVA